MGEVEHTTRCPPTDVQMKRNLEGARDSAFCLKMPKVVNMLVGCLDLGGQQCVSDQQPDDSTSRTLIAIVWTIAITSSELFEMRLSGSDGSYSQMAVVFSIAANFIISPITVTMAMLTT